MIDPPPREVSEVSREELGSVIGGNGIWNDPACKQGEEEINDHLGGDGTSGKDLRPFGLEIVGDQQKALVLRDAMELVADIQLNVGPWCLWPRQGLQRCSMTISSGPEGSWTVSGAEPAVATRAVRAWWSVHHMCQHS